MFLPRLRAIAILTVTLAVSGAGYQSSPANRPWPPEVQKVPDQSPPLTPAEALRTFYMPPGYRVELVASEPLIQEPVAIDWDTRGRLWAVEMPGWMPDITAAGEHDPVGRVVVLEDKDDDGRMDKRTVFADGLVLARSVKVLDRGVLVGEPPNAWLMHDTDGDLRMDRKELITAEYGRREVDPQNNANGFYWALDNQMHTAGQSEVLLRLKNGRFDVRPTLRRGEWGVTQDDAGRIYRNTNESALHVDLVPTPYYARHPSLVRTRGSYERLASDDNGLNTVWPVRPNPGTNRAYQTGIDRADGSLTRFTSVCAPVIYRGDRLPAELYGNAFVAEPAANLVSRIAIEDDGTTIRARKAYDRGEFLASTDERFRPVFLSNAPDGTLYIADLYRGIIEHRISITMYLRDQIVARRLEQPVGYGRIYRVVHETTRRDSSPALAGASPAQLVSALGHPNGWRRDTAQMILVEREVTSVAPELRELARSATDWRTRVHAMWTLDGIDAIDPAIVAAALNDQASEVRTAAVRLAERWLGIPGHRIQAEVLKRMTDPHWSVREQLAASLGSLPPGTRETTVAAFLDRHGDDPVAMDAALSGIRGSESALLDNLLRSTVHSAQRDAALTMLAATMIRSNDDALSRTVLTGVTEDMRPAWQRSALLRGAEVALLGAVMPGTPARRSPAPSAAALPCPTCPGGRAGPGGAYAFPRPAGETAQAPGRGGPTLRLDRIPEAFVSLAAGSGELATRAGSVLARTTWPGKAGDAPRVAPLSAEEQRRFEIGQEVYRNICQACHQPDGRGQERVAPSLIGSPLALAAAEIPTRILLNGKEGPIGLMPPIGFALTDEQLAGVLTYIRRAWDQTGTPVDIPAVQSVRAQTAGRLRPWTDAELKALMDQSRPRE
jgi:mono/diheme cytochrome c family protein/glucose/arabinose dehydrogenase